MKNTFGNTLTLTLFGESHGPAVGAVLDGLPPGLPVSEDSIARRLARGMHGDLVYRPREGGGSVFELALPRA